MSGSGKEAPGIFPHYIQLSIHEYWKIVMDFENQASVKDGC